MRLIITLCTLSLFSIVGAQKWHSTKKYPERGGTQPTATPVVVTERQRRELPTDGLFHDLYKRSAEKEEGNEPSELPEAGEGVEIPEDGEGETGGEVEKRQATVKSEDATNGEERRLARQVQDSKEDVRPFRKRRDQVSALHGKHGRKRRQVDTCEEEKKQWKKRQHRRFRPLHQQRQPLTKHDFAVKLIAKSKALGKKDPKVAVPHRERLLRNGESERAKLKRNSESLAKGEPEQPIESANDAESASRVRRVSRAGSSHRNRPSTVNRMSKTSGNNGGDTQQQSPDEGSA
ncbi:hypothetical protein AAVH_10588 [Aphelenchoides avenae]|nr:hypothetical protein AAVH_10588 [Aphelenchus avenae]